MTAYAAYVDDVLTEFTYGEPFELEGQHPATWWAEAAPGDFTALGLQEVVEPDATPDGQRVTATELVDDSGVYTREATYEDIPLVDELIPETRNAIRAMLMAKWARAVNWHDVASLDLSPLGIAFRFALGELLTRKQLPDEPWAENTNATPAEFNFSIAGSVATIHTMTVGRVGVGSVFESASVVAGTIIVGRLAGGLGEEGDYLVSPAQTVAAEDGTSEGWYRDIVQAGDGSPLRLPDAAVGYDLNNAQNMLGQNADAFLYLQTLFDVAATKLDALDDAEDDAVSDEAGARVDVLAIRAAINTGWGDPEIPA